MQGDAACRGAVSHYVGALASPGKCACIRPHWLPPCGRVGLLQAYVSWLFLPDATRMRIKLMGLWVKGWRGYAAVIKGRAAFGAHGRSRPYRTRGCELVLKVRPWGVMAVMHLPESARQVHGFSGLKAAWGPRIPGERGAGH